MPFKVWAVGEEVLAADFNDYVQEQVVATFPNAAARTAAIPAPLAGMVTWRTDAKVLEQWDGAAWVPIGPRGALLVTNTAQSAQVPGTRTAVVGLGSVTYPAGRRIRLRFWSQALAAPSGANVTVRVEVCTQGGSPIHATGYGYAFDGARVASFSAESVLTPAAGAITYDLYAQSTGGTAAIGAGVFTVEDLGAAP